MINKIRLSLIIYDWKLRGWIDNSSPIWFKIIFWGNYHFIQSLNLELKK